MSETIGSFCKGFEQSGKTYAVVHRDCDEVEPAHARHAAELEGELRAAGVKNPIAATPAWEIEAWWMLFPDALHAMRPGWSRVDYHGQEVGKFENAKERLRRDLRPKHPGKKNKVPDFSSQDALRLVEIIASDPNHISKIEAVSHSFSDFRAKIQAITEK